MTTPAKRFNGRIRFKPNIEPWERQDDESSQAFEAFVAYRDMEADRSLVLAARKIGKHPSMLARWSSQWRWVQRVAAYERFMDAQRVRVQVYERRKMNDRHASMSMLVQQRVLDRIKNLKPEELSPSECVRWLEAAVRIERMARGEAVPGVQVGVFQTQNTLTIESPEAKMILDDPEALDVLHRITERARLAGGEVGGDGLPALPGDAGPQDNGGPV